MGKDKQINIISPICKTSYGYVGQNLIKAFINAGFKVSLKPIGQVDPDVECGYDQYLNQCSPIPYANVPNLIIWHQGNLKDFCVPGMKNVGFPFFELDRFTKEEISSLNSCDTLICPSNWGISILKKVFDKPIGLAPLGVDPDIFVPEQRQFPANGYSVDKTCKFLHIGKWEVRKNQIAILKAFQNVFKDKDNVSLTLLCYNSFIGTENQKWLDLAHKLVPFQFPRTLNSEGFGVNILPIPLNSHRDINVLMNSHDIGLFPSLAEGWNLELSELMWLNKPCICTEYSAHTQFAQDGGAKLVAMDEIEASYDFKWFWGQGNWGKFGIDQQMQLEQHMLTLYNQFYRPGGLKLDNSKFREKYTWANTIKAISQFLNLKD